VTHHERASAGEEVAELAGEVRRHASVIGAHALGRDLLGTAR
jgi:hypothetical protein